MVETNTNKLLRKKYFVEADEVVSSDSLENGRPTEHYSRILDASQVVVSKKKVCLVEGGNNVSDSIEVNVVRDADRVKGINIQCPCGRHAELDFEYSGAEKSNMESSNG